MMMDLDKQRLQKLVELATVLNVQSDFQEILSCLTQHGVDQLDAGNCLILMVNPRTRQTLKTIHREGRVEKKRDFTVFQSLVSGWIMKHNRSLLSADIRIDNRFANAKFDSLPLGSVLGVPVKSQDLVIGTILLFKQDGQPVFTRQDQDYLEMLTAICAPYLRNAPNIEVLFQSRLPDASLQAKFEQIGLLGKSERFMELLRAIEAVASSEVRVLLAGPSGTGKELVARAIHQFSARGKKPFVAIDCGAIPENLLESELFGHVRGAFTGANSERRGLFEEANGGTLFMDEIANLPLPMQSKLMRVLQEGEVRPLGRNKVRAVDVRIVAASSPSLRELIDEGKFREDLFFRLYVYPVAVPSLGERREDIPLLANHFLRRFSMQQDKKIASLHGQIMDFLRQRKWRGNIRELENLIERLVTVSPPGASTIEPNMLPPDLLREFKKFRRIGSSLTGSKSLDEEVGEYEVQLIEEALKKHDWNQSQAARSLKISERKMRYKMEKLKITPPSKS